jgi:hypothetical protein
MAKISIPCLVGKTNKGGITSWYWQPSKTLAAAGWKPMSLGKDMNRAMVEAQARNAEVEQWKLGDRRPAGIARKDPAGTFGALIQRYRREVLEGKDASGRPLLADTTKRGYSAALKRLEEWAGKHPLAYITPARVRTLRDAVARPVEAGGIGHAPAHSLLKMLRVVMGFAEDTDAIPKGSNPATNFDLGAPASRKIIWTPEDDAAFDAAAFALGLPSMAFARELALYTAQREGDLIKFTEHQLTKLDIHELEVSRILADQDGIVYGWCFAQKKTSTNEMDVLMEIPLEPQILGRCRAALRTNRARDRAADPIRPTSYVIIDDYTGLPYSERQFIRRWNKVLKQAAVATGREGMLKLHWHDLRRTRVVRLRRRGMPKEMIAAITGHSLASISAMLKVYGPVDPTITAAAIASTLTRRAGAELEDDRSNKTA